MFRISIDQYENLTDPEKKFVEEVNKKTIYEQEVANIDMPKLIALVNDNAKKE